MEPAEANTRAITEVSINDAQLSRDANRKEFADCFGTLERLFSTEWSAPSFIRSADPSLSAGQVPPVFKELTEGEFIWRNTLNPSTHEAQILARQHTITALKELGDSAQLRLSKNIAYLLADGVAKIFAPIRINEDSGATLPAIRLYRASLKRTGGNAVDEEGVSSIDGAAAKLVQEGLRNIEMARGGLAGCIKALEGSGDELLQTLAKDLRVSLNEAAHLDEEFFIAHSGDEIAVREFGKQFNQRIVMLGSLIELSLISTREGWACCGFDAAGDAYYKAGSSILCPESKDHLNDSPTATPVTAYVGSNMSGKTESGLKQNFSIQLLAQAWGYSSVAEGNFHIHDSFFYLDRASTEHEKGLSAFGREVVNLCEMLAQLGERSFGCFDEFGSTTSPDDQFRLLLAVALHLVGRGGRIHLATHNEQFAEAAGRIDAIRLYHYATTLDDLYKMHEGPADSNSIQVARGLAFDEEILQSAEEYLQGILSIPALLEQPVWPSVAPYSEEERARLKQTSARVDEVFFKSGAKNGRFLALFSDDKDFSRGLLPVEGAQHRYFGAPDMSLGGWSCSAGGNAEFIGKFVLEVPKLTGPEILERQRMFTELGERDCYHRLHELSAHLAYIQKFLPYLEGCAAELLHFNRLLFDLSSRHRYAPDRVAFAAANLRMNKKLFGDNFHFDDALAQCSALATLHEQLEDYYRRQSCADVVAVNNQEWLREVDRETAEEFMQLCRERGDAEQAPGPVTAGQISEYLGRISEHSWRECAGMATDSRWARVFSARHACPRESLSLEQLLGDALQLPAVSAAGGELTCQQLEDLLAAQDPYENQAEYAALRCAAATVHQTQFQMLVPDPVLRARLQGAASAAGLAIDEIELSQAGLVTLCEHVLHAIEQKVPPALPAVCAFDVDLSSVRNELLTIIDYIKETNREGDFDYYNRWPPALLAAIQLEIALGEQNVLTEFTGILRSYDSVSLHQLANSIEERFAGMGCVAKPDLSGSVVRSCRELKAPKEYWRSFRKSYSLLVPPDRIEQVDRETKRNGVTALDAVLKQHLIDAPQKPFQNVAAAYRLSFRNLHREFLALEAEYRRVAVSHPWVADYYGRNAAGSFLKDVSKSPYNDINVQHFLSNHFSHRCTPPARTSAVLCAAPRATLTPPPKPLRYTSVPPSALHRN